MRKNIFKNITYYEYKKRFLIMSFLFSALIFLIFFLLMKSYASYSSISRLNSNINRALYIFDDKMMTFNIDMNKIIPRDEVYKYKFSISNFNANQTSDVDIEYSLKIKTTTNLPLNISLYKNEEYSTTATNILKNPTLKQDEDKAWYKTFSALEGNYLYYKNKTTDIYILVISFPKQYGEDTKYVKSIENIEITINSKQMI